MFKQPPHHSPAMQNITSFFYTELRHASSHLLQQRDPQNPFLEKSPVSDPIPFVVESSGFHPAFDDGGYEVFKYPLSDCVDFDWSTSEYLFPGFEEQAFPLKEHAAPVVSGKAFQELAPAAGKDLKHFLLLVEPGKAVKAKTVGVVEVTGLIPTNPEEKEAFCRGLSFNSGFHATDDYVKKLCLAGGSAGGLQSWDLTHTYVGDYEAIKMLLAFAEEKSLADLICQAQEDCAEKHGKEAEAEFVMMVESCPKEVLAKFYSVELWNNLTLEDKVKEDFAKLVLCKRPEIIYPPPAASINYPVPSVDWKPSSSIAKGRVKYCFLVPDLNEKYEDEAGENADEKAKSKKKKVEAPASGGEGPDHVPIMPAFPAFPAANPPN